MSANEGYRDIAYRRYDATVRPDYEKFANAYARRLAGKLAIRPDWRCIDIACGYGNFLAYLRKAGVTEYVGIDSAGAATTVAQNEFGANHVTTTDAFDFLRKNEVPQQLVSALDFIEHLHKDEVFEFLALTRLSLVAGGHLLLRTPNANAPFGMAARYNDITHETCFTTGAIEDALSAMGLKTVRIWEDIPRPGTPMQLFHWLAWQSVRAVFRVANAVETGLPGDGVLTRNMWVLARKVS